MTSKYPRTIGLFYRSPAIWAYSILYGLISFGFTLGYEPLVRSGVLAAVGPQADGAAPAKGGTEPKDQVKAKAGEVPKAGTPGGGGVQIIHTSWVVAIILGLSAKALLHIRLFSVTAQGSQQPFPVGTETIVQLFEPWLLGTIALHEDAAVSSYLAQKAASYPILANVKTEIKNNTPNFLTEAEKTALHRDVDQATSVRPALEIYLRAFGTTRLELTFPIPPPVVVIPPAGGS